MTHNPALDVERYPEVPAVTDVYAFDPSKVYAVQVDRRYLTREQADLIVERFKRHGVSVIVLASDVHIVTPPEASAP